jgi:hypothetical protein
VIDVGGPHAAERLAFPSVVPQSDLLSSPLRLRGALARRAKSRMRREAVIAASGNTAMSEGALYLW